MITGSADNTIYLFDRITGHANGYLKGHHASITHLEVFQNNKMLASVDEERNIKIWDLKENKQLNTFQGHFDRITALSISDIKYNTILNSVYVIKGLINNAHE